MKNDFSIRMKQQEKIETEPKLNASLPIVMRLDGRAFSKFTKKLQKPFDVGFCHSMKETAKVLMKEFGADCAYQQSDEITLVYGPRFIPNVKNSQLPFSGKKQKICSVFAGMATASFLCNLTTFHPDLKDYIFRNMPHFDCRAFNTPTKEEAINHMIWRSQDASRNAIGMMARYLFSHKQLQGKSTKERLKMVQKESDIYETCSDDLKFGSFFFREKVMKNDVERTVIVEQSIPFPKFNTILEKALLSV